MLTDGDGTSDVHVFQGKVQTDQLNEQGKLVFRRILLQGEALRFTKFTGSNAPNPKAMTVDRTAFKSTLSSRMVTHYSFDGPLGTEDVALRGSVDDKLTLFEGATVVSDAGGQGKRPSKVLQLTES